MFPLLDSCSSGWSCFAGTAVLTLSHAARKSAGESERLGYQETGCHYLDRYDYIDTDGVRRQAADPTRFLIKPLERDRR